jgi:hypothetical protein
MTLFLVASPSWYWTTQPPSTWVASSTGCSLPSSRYGLWRIIVHLVCPFCVESFTASLPQRDDFKAFVDTV